MSQTFLHYKVPKMISIASAPRIIDILERRKRKSSGWIA
jgi:hypothetical protein